jgi:hypothetical protein
MIEQSIVHLPQAGKGKPSACNSILRCTYQVDAAWPVAVINVLVEEGVAVSELRWVGRTGYSKAENLAALPQRNPTRGVPRCHRGKDKGGGDNRGRNQYF